MPFAFPFPSTRAAAADHTRLIAVAFSIVDADGSGRIEGEEIRAMLQQLGWESTDDAVRTFMSAADVNGDGSLDLQEFAAAFAKVGEELRRGPASVRDGEAGGESDARDPGDLLQHRLI